MRVLGYIHTYNDSDVIDRSLEALRRQSRQADGILIVDNASSDETLERDFPPEVTLIRHEENRGTAGAVAAGFHYALEHGYEWIWILDADSAPRQDALEKLLDRWEALLTDRRSRVLFIASLLVDSVSGRAYYGTVFHRRGSTTVVPEPDAECCEIDAALWSGCLFRLDAVRRLGPPPTDYVIDRDDFAYGYRGKRAGLEAFMELGSIVDHNIGGCDSLQRTRGVLGLPVFELPPMRCYYVVRNTLLFWLYEFESPSTGLVAVKIGKVMGFTASFLLRPRGHRSHIGACFRGLLDGLLRRAERRYRP